MAKTPKKVAVIGLDCALTHLIEKHIAEGRLPTFKKLFEGGVVAENCLVPFPTITPPNWATIATGAWPGTHSITDFWVHKPGTTPINLNTEEAFSSERCQAEFLWDVADRIGKKCIVLNYPGSWPSKMENGIMIGGSGLTVGNYNDGELALNTKIALCGDQLITTGIYPGAMRGSLEAAEGWTNAPEMGDDPLGLEVSLVFPAAKDKPAPTTWYVLARDTGGSGYDQVTLSPTKDFNDAFCTLGVGEWSPRIVTRIKMEDGSESEVFFRCKLVELSDDAEDFRLYITGLGVTSGWSMPEDIAKEIVSEEGTLGRGGGMGSYVAGWIDKQTYVEVNEQYSRWLADAATSLMKNHEWDIFFMHSHPTDWVYHAIMTYMDPATCPDEAKRKEAWEIHLGIYETQDRMLASILDAMDKNTLVILVSDHGATPDGPLFDPYKALVPAGLSVLQEAQDDMGLAQGKFSEAIKLAALRPDLARTKAMPQRSCYIYINLKGRDPEGIVDPEDYEKVQQEIIDALLTFVDQGTGQRPVALALPKRDARILGLYGDGIGDVVYAIRPEFGSQHGSILPTAEYGVGSLKALFSMTGPGVKKGFRLKRTCWLPDIVPTICYLMDWPLPEQTEGAVLYQAFKDANFKLKEINKLKDGLARMETALARQDREPWDKHDCA
ncbi:MAG: alkaline phosphatase family protein [Deltaproteobacteria bacterium]|nr:alkaline phosphatase family protein [Deltaproteobacteria bacterium]MBW2086229.1 alkaline phosphatase family protein [Deltaproteobacteria bacterium]